MPAASLTLADPAGLVYRRLVGQPPLERAPPALARRLQGQVDEVADHEVLPAHFAEHGERDVLSPGEIAEPTELAAAQGDEHPGLALPEEKRVGPDAPLESDAHPEPRTAERALRERYREATFADVVRGAQQALAHGGQADTFEAALDVEIDPRRRAAHHPVDDRQILARAEFFARPPEEGDHVPFALPPRRYVQIDVLQE